MLSSKKIMGLLSVAALFGVSQTSYAQTVTAAMVAPPNSVDLTKPGFKVRVFKGNSRINPTAAAPAEQIISGVVIDPGTNLLLQNIADRNSIDDTSPYFGSYFYELPTYINEHEQASVNPAVQGGNFFPGATTDPADRDRNEDPVPGMQANSDYYVVEYTGFIQLPSGTVRVGVNSDDGFKLTIGQGLDPYALAAGTPGETGVQVAILDGTRGFANTEANMTVNSAGLYPFRLIFWESGGANSGCEFYNFTAGSTSGNIFLVNDTNTTGALKTYRQALSKPPLVSGKYPVPASTGVEAQPFVRAIIDEIPGNALDTNTIVLRLDGVVTPPQSIAKYSDQDTLSTLIIAQPPNAFLPNTLHTNTITYADAAGVKYTNSWSYTVANYPTIPASWSLGTVDTNKPGFRAKVVQMALHKAPQTSVFYAAERQLANGFIDPATGQPFPNLANLKGPIDDPGNPGTPIPGTETAPVADSEGYFIDPDVINWAENDAGTSNQGDFPNDETTPGITVNYDPVTGVAVPRDSYVFSIETILELKAGIYRLGINSDDGCRLTFGKGPGDVTGTQVFVANADRGPTDSMGDFAVTADGFYPFRMMWWETGGGSAGEFFLFNYTTSAKILINTNSAIQQIMAWRESTNTPPHLTRVLPVVGEPYAFADTDVTFDITERSLPVNASSIKLLVGSTAQTGLVINKTNNITTVVRPGSVNNLLASGNNTFTVIYDYTPNGGGANVSVTNTWTVTVPPYIRPLQANTRVQPTEVSGTGFLWNKNIQIDRTGDANQGNGGRYVQQGGGGNNMPGPEIELYSGYLKVDGTPYTNLIDSVTWDLYETPILNFNWTTTGTGNSGLFNSDVRGPALPGLGTSNAGLDNSVHEIFTYIDLKKGAHIMGINVDDGWMLINAANTHDTLGTLVGYKNAPGGNNGFPLNNPNAAFTMIAPEDGIYPFRLLFWEGGGGVNIEWAAVDRNTGILSLVNDVGGTMPPAQPAAIGGAYLPSTKYTTYSTYSGPVKPWTKFSVYPMRNDNTLFQNPIQMAGPGPMKIRVPGGNPVDIANDAPGIRPFGDYVGAIVADLGASDTVGMLLDGNAVTPTVSAITGSSDKLVTFTPATPFAGGSTHTAALVYAGTTNYWTFIVIAQTTVTNNPAAPMKTLADVDTTKKGFLLKVVQQSAARATTVAAAEQALTNTAVNVAIPGPLTGGSYQADMINYNATKNTGGGTPADTGNFTLARSGQADIGFPGIPGTGLTGGAGVNNFTMEIFAYLDLPAGYQKFGFNGDDGWAVKINLPGDPTGQVLFTTDRGAGNRDIPFAFITPSAGLFPVRITYYQGTGGANAEFFTYGADNNKHLVNDLNDPLSVKAYYALAGGDAPKILNTALSGGNITFTWTGGGELQTATNIIGPWTGTGNTSGSASIPATAAGTVFYRISK